MIRTRGIHLLGGRWAALFVLAIAPPVSAQVATISVIDSAGDVGGISAVAYGPDGLALIAYFDATSSALKAAHCNDVACTSSTKSTLASGNVSYGPGMGVAFGPDGRALISYQTGNSVNVARCVDAVCSSATSTTVEVLTGPPQGTASLVGLDGLAVLTYGDSATDALKVAHCSDPDCAAATITAYAGRGGRNPSLTVGGDGLPVVAGDRGMIAFGSLSVGHCSDAACTAATWVSPFGLSELPWLDYYTDGSLATRADGRAILAYWYYHVDSNGPVWANHLSQCTDVVCTGLAPVPPYSGVSSGGGPVVAIMPGDRPLLVEQGPIQSQYQLVVTRCPDPSCSVPQVDAVDGPGTGSGAAVAISPAGIGLVTYYDSVQQDLKAAYLEGPSQISVGDVTVTEGDGGTTAAVFQVGQTGSGGASIDFTTGGGTATPGVDYMTTSGTVVFPPGSSTQTITVPVMGDLQNEPDETFFVTLSNPQGGVIGDGEGVGTITNDDPPAHISVGDVTLIEGDTGTASAVFMVTWTGTGGTSVDYATGSGSATPGIDYLPASGTLILPQGTNSDTITVPVLGDPAVEPNETFLLVLSNPQGGVIDDGEGQATIVDDDIGPVPVTTELAHGSQVWDDLAANPGPYADVDHFRIGQAPYSSYEVIADGISGDVQPIELVRTAADGTTILQTASPVGVGFSVTLRWLTSTLPVPNEFIRVKSGGCAKDCGIDDVYRLRAYDTTLAGARFNNSGTQTTVLLLQNPTDDPVDATVYFWAVDGSLLATYVSPTLAARTLLALNTAQVPGLSGVGGTLTVAHTASYAGLSGKAVALEPATGFSFDTPLLPRPR
jgi:Calx-beta domain-containing protein